ncbi:epithelial cell adhesion molecule [Hoplias malabaricus]|uniref:epithelial cell adhesion molecule n=1 Tax=Hoplias malabaricus TaxID=27720 RepID=UPI00346337A4
MKVIIALCLLALVAGASAQCETCSTMKWALCDGSPCQCQLPVGTAGAKLTLDCTNLIPKCFLMQAEMYRVRNKLDTRTIGGKPVEEAIVDNDGIYDPECESDGRFKAVQCNHTDTCWCVNSAGVRRSDKGDRNIKCEPVETIWVRLQLTHNPAAVNKDQLKGTFQSLLSKRYNTPTARVDNVDYDPDASRIVVDVKKDAKDPVDLPRMAYYMEKDVKMLPLFKDQTPLKVTVSGNDVTFKDIVVYYVDDKPPTFTMKSLTGGVIAVIVVVVLAVVIGILVLFFLRRREQARYGKTQAKEMENLS